ncbi:hypothetical protein R1flu_001830 [Riccia fluitans]|uniref:Late embryogenesis abundant protein LEA-2 subgroup domain-containing protein n=1 Tax=Riccia fluitans TaxID=41844 RepID=A0ABD1Y4J5_9MARC
MSASCVCFDLFPEDSTSNEVEEHIQGSVRRKYSLLSPSQLTAGHHARGESVPGKQWQHHANRTVSSSERLLQHLHQRSSLWQGLTFYLLVRPKVPEFEVTDFRLEGLDTSLTAQQMSTTSTVSISSYNGNKKISFDFKSINVHVTTNVKTGDVSVGDGTLPPVFLGKGETVKLQGVFKATPMAMGKDTQAALIKAQNTRNLPLKVNMDLKTRIQMGSIKFIKIKVKVRCNIAVDPSVTTGSQILNKACTYKARPYV